MKPQLTRRDILKLGAALSLTPLLSVAKDAQIQRGGLNSGQDRPNVIIILFDALSARDLSVYGYLRETAPNISRFASRATVYHAHHSAGNFTSPSTASFFTGVYPWTHRILRGVGIIEKDNRTKNLFKLLEDSFYRCAYVQNPYADAVLLQFNESIDRHYGSGDSSHIDDTFYDSLSLNDAALGYRSLDLFLMRDSSLFLLPIDRMRVAINKKILESKYANLYPDGVPTFNSFHYFLLEKVFDDIMGLLGSLPEPFFTYIHLSPPHEPYRPHSNFIGKFDAGWAPPVKEQHPLASKLSAEALTRLRRRYDEYLASADAEFGRLLDYMEDTGLLDNSYVMVTSDHGQMFERGVHGHSTPLLFEPVIHIPLIISQPKQRERRDIHLQTNTVDLLPTLLHLADKPIPDWCAGRVLPGFGEEENSDRGLYTVEAKTNAPMTPLRLASIALIKENYKLTYYKGYPRYKDEFELYDLVNDPEELNNLYSPGHSVAKELQAELLEKLQEEDQTYLGL